MQLFRFFTENSQQKHVPIQDAIRSEFTHHAQELKTTVQKLDLMMGVRRRSSITSHKHLVVGSGGRYEKNSAKDASNEDARSGKMRLALLVRGMEGC